MSVLFRGTAAKIAVAATAVLVGGGVAASLAISRPTAAPPPVDHQLCYSASGTHFKIPSGIRLINQFSPNGFVPKISSSLFLHCNPVQKTLATGKTFKITNPNAHVGCYGITAPKQPTPTVVVTNQFGTATLVPGQPNALCVPSWKSLTGPPNKKPTTPPGLSHFTCYPVRVKSGAYKPPPVTLKDEFAKKPVPATVNPVPVELCLPTEKIVGGKVYKIINTKMHLLVFPVTRTPFVPKVWDENQFGTSPVTINGTKYLAVPSTKKVVPPPPPPVDHQLCYSASGTHYKVPTGIRLINQFSPKGFVPKISSTLFLHCNPVQKTLPATGRTFKITNPNAHVGCYGITAPKQPTPAVQVTNQFGTAILAPGQPNALCLPSWKSLTGPPNKKPTTPPGLSHFTCYPVSVQSGAYKPPPVMLKDEFAKKPVAATVSPVPVELCLPTEKIVGGKDYKIINRSMHLLVFPVTKTPFVPKVWDENQFGTSPVTINGTAYLAVPSTKKLVG